MCFITIPCQALKVDLKLYVKMVIPSLFVDEELKGKVSEMMLVLY